MKCVLKKWKCVYKCSSVLLQTKLCWAITGCEILDIQTSLERLVSFMVYKLKVIRSLIPDVSLGGILNDSSS